VEFRASLNTRIDTILFRLEQVLGYDYSYTLGPSDGLMR
jgi:hypothetical protein